MSSNSGALSQAFNENIEKYPEIGEYVSQSGSVVDVEKSTLENITKFKSTHEGKELEGGKVILVGPSGAGKTCLFRRLLENEYSDNYKVTVGFDFQSKCYNVLNVPFRISLWDTSGEERFQSLSATYFRGADVALLCFDLTSYDSFLECDSVWLPFIQKNCEKDTLLCLVGCKGDELSPFEGEEIEKFARTINAEYWETSSKANKNVRNVFRRATYLTFDRVLKKKIEESTRKKETVELNVGNGKKGSKGCKCK